jgi:photosystem II stability/assembly factor-like uncharacterized protein
MATAVVAASGVMPHGPGRQHPPPAPDAVPSQAPSIQALTVQGQTVFAGSFGSGIFRSDDRGSSWSGTNNGLSDPFILALASGPDGTVYAGTFHGGVFRSKDSGASWQTINDGLKRLEIKALLVRDGTVYAGTGDGVYRLSPSDNRWSVLTGGLDDTLVHAIAIASDHTVYVGTSGKGLFRFKSQDPSRPNWQRLSEGLKDHEGLIENFIRVLAVDRDQALYAGTFDGGVFRSTDGGEHWRPISRALPNDSIRGIVATDKGLFVATGRGVFHRPPDAAKWQPASRGMTELSVQVLIPAADGALYAGTSAGVFRSDDEGRNWIGVNDGLEGGSVSPFTFR